MSNCVCTWNLWYCNVVEPVIKDVIVTKEYHELCSLTRQWSFISFVANPVFYRPEWLVALKRLPCTVENVTVHSQSEVVDWLNKKKLIEHLCSFWNMFIILNTFEAQKIIFELSGENMLSTNSISTLFFHSSLF